MTNTRISIEDFVANLSAEADADFQYEIYEVDDGEVSIGVPGTNLCLGLNDVASPQILVVFMHDEEGNGEVPVYIYRAWNGSVGDKIAELFV